MLLDALRTNMLAVVKSRMDPSIVQRQILQFTRLLWDLDFHFGNRDLSRLPPEDRSC